jgi:hypothetical protein
MYVEQQIVQMLGAAAVDVGLLPRELDRSEQQHTFEETLEQAIIRLQTELAAKDEDAAGDVGPGDAASVPCQGQEPEETPEQIIARMTQELAANQEQLAANQTEIMWVTEENAALRATATDEEGIPPPS